MMPILKDAKTLYVGGTQAKKAYLGSTLVWQPQVPTLPVTTGLITRLDATQAGNLSVRWDDLSGLGHHGTIYSSPAPTLQPNAPNGLSVVRFKVNEGRVRSGQTFNFSGNGAYNFTIIYVTRMWGDNLGRVYTGQYPEGGNFLIGMHTQSIDCMYAEGWVYNPNAWPARPTPWRIYTGTGYHDGTTYTPKFYVNGVLMASGGGTGGMGNYYNISGYDATATQETCDCEVAELLIYDHQLLDSERQQVEGYLKTKWGL